MPSGHVHAVLLPYMCGTKFCLHYFTTLSVIRKLWVEICRSQSNPDGDDVGGRYRVYVPTCFHIEGTRSLLRFIVPFLR